MVTNERICTKDDNVSQIDHIEDGLSIQGNQTNERIAKDDNVSLVYNRPPKVIYR